MNSRTTRDFRNAFAKLPPDIQRQAREAYQHFSTDPNHPGLRFKKVHASLPVYSARISQNYRTVGVIDGDTVIWFWVGKHEDYNRLLKYL